MFLSATGTLMQFEQAVHTYSQARRNIGFEALPTIEWQSMELGRAAGFIVPPLRLSLCQTAYRMRLPVEQF